MALTSELMRVMEHSVDGAVATLSCDVRGPGAARCVTEARSGPRIAVLERTAEAVTGGSARTLIDAWRIQRASPVVHVANAPSPAATSSLSIGADLRDEVLTVLDGARS